MCNVRIIAAVLIIFAALSYCGQENCRFEDGDRVCFVGDSITHSGTYHSLVYLYYATRFPEKKIHIYNCGIGGDTAGGVLRRFEWDIEPYKPDVVAVMLGMNDVGRADYHTGQTTDAQAASKAEHIGQYHENMQQLAAKFKSLGSSMIFITPSIYDQTARIECPNNYGANDALKSFADFNMALSKKNDGCLVDFHNPMRRINEQLQTSDPSLTIVGSDRIHPGRVGNFVMAYLFLTSQGMPEYVSRAVIDASDKKFDTINCGIEKLEVSDKGVSFECLSQSLPFPVSPDYEKALELVGFTNSLNKEIIAVKGLKGSNYDMIVDGKSLGTFSGSQLADGVNLAVIKDSPSCVQAVKVAELNEQRRLIEFDLRTLIFVEHMMLKRRIVEPFDMDKLRLELEASMKQRENTSTYDNYRRKVDLYYAKKPVEKSMRQNIEELIDLMYVQNKPVSHKFSVKMAD